MNEKFSKAMELFDSNFNCAQSVIGAFCAQSGIDEKILMKLSSGFGGGMRCGEVCGAVSGAVIMIGLQFGQSVADDIVSKEKCNQIVREFMERYIQINGTVLCRELLGYDIRNIENKVIIQDRIKEVCPQAIETAVRILEEIGFK